MKTNNLLIIAVITVLLAACGAGSKKSNDMEKRTQVKIETTMGDIVVELYNETPKHRDNFIKLAKEGVYDSTLFHRVIRQFMIQAGDPESKTANDTAMLGGGDVGYTIPAEFVPKFFHKKGALAAARMGDDVNPNRESSGCQFYIVTGRKFRESQLLDMAGQKNNARLDTLFNQLVRKHMKDTLLLKLAGLSFLLKAILLLFAPSVTAIYLIQLLQATSYTFLSPTQMYYARSRISMADMVKGQAFITASYTLGCAAGNFAGGQLLQHFSVPAMLLGGILMAALGTAVLWLTVERKDMEMAENGENSAL